MKLHDLHNTPGSRKKRKIVGRGDGSGLGGTAGRGHKGQKARSGANMRPFFEGGQIPFFRRLPKRGFKSLDHKHLNTVNVSILETSFSAGDMVDEEILRKKGIIGKKFSGLKILGTGELTKSLTVRADAFSESARQKVEAAGGKCDTVEQKEKN